VGGVVLAVWLERDVVRVSGPDAESYLQGQLSQDMGAIGAGEAAWSLLLQPQGKVDAFLRVTRAAGDDFVLDTDRGWGERVVERLQRFKLRTKADIDPLDWRALAVRDTVEAPSGELVVPFEWNGLTGFDVLGAAPATAGALGDPAEYERRRIEAGFPMMGRELDERTIPAEAGVVERAVSFTKGCYTGQELVARIDSRGGNVPRHLRLIRIEGAVPPPGGTLHTSGKEVGVLTSVAPAGQGGGAVALGYVSRSVEVPATLDVRWDGGSGAGAATATVGGLS
jgi:folate-binding protein YgfZ